METFDIYTKCRRVCQIILSSSACEESCDDRLARGNIETISFTRICHICGRSASVRIRRWRMTFDLVDLRVIRVVATEFRIGLSRSVLRACIGIRTGSQI